MKRGGGRAWHLFFLPLEVSAKTEVTGVEISLSPLLDCPKKQLLSQPLARQSVLQEGTLDSKSHPIPGDGPLSGGPLARCLGSFFLSLLHPVSLTALPWCFTAFLCRGPHLCFGLCFLGKPGKSN